MGQGSTIRTLVYKLRKSRNTAVELKSLQSAREPSNIVGFVKRYKFNIAYQFVGRDLKCAAKTKKSGHPHIPASGAKIVERRFGDHVMELVGEGIEARIPTLVEDYFLEFSAQLLEGLSVLFRNFSRRQTPPAIPSEH